MCGCVAVSCTDSLQFPLFLNGRITSVVVSNFALTIASFVYIYPVYKWRGLACWLPTFALFVLYLDTQVDHLCGRNIVSMRKLGYSDFRIFAIAMQNYLGLQAMICFVLNHLIAAEKFTISYYLQNFGFGSLVKVLINMALADWAFAAGHSMLHTIPSLRKYVF